MTKAKAQTVAGALINLDFTVQVVHDGDNPPNYTIIVQSGSDIDANTVADFANNQGIIASVNSVRLT